MNLLALDPATRCGWAMTPVDVLRVECGSWQLLSGGLVREHEKAADLARQMKGFLKRHEVAFAAVEVPMAAPPRRGKRVVKTKLGFDVEEASSGSTGTQNQLWTLHGAIILALVWSGIPYRTVAAPTWRKDILGKYENGRAKQLCKQVLEDQGVRVPNLDAAEAGAMAVWLSRRHRRFKLEDEALRRAA